jgi:hypothetical protein
MSFDKLAYVAPLTLILGCGSSMMPFQPGGNGTKDMSIPLGDFAAGGNDDLASPDGGRVALIDMAGFNMPGSPLVVIDSPTPTTEVQYDLLAVTATITSPKQTAIDSSSVSLAITPPNGGIVSVPMTIGTTPGVYVGSIDIGAIPSGTSSFTVSASDIMGRKGSATGTYIHDHGPNITFLQPAAATAHGSVTVELLVDDPLHPVTDPTMVTAYIHTAPSDIALVQEPNAVPMRLSAIVDFSKFNPPLDGPQIINATAVNPKGTTTHASKQFIVDNAGPIISIVQPLPGKFVGGVIEVIAKITDLSGVNDATALAVFANDPTHFALPLSRVTPGSDDFHGFFDVRSLGRNMVLPELSITANDNLGNSSQYGEEISVDNTPPEMTMDSNLEVYMYLVDSNGNHICSQLFSPLGPNTGSPPEAAYDGATVDDIFAVRARIQDRGNTAPGLLEELYSGLQASSIAAYVIHDDGMTPLAVDTNGDGICDNVNPQLVPSTTSAMKPGTALSVALVAMQATNSAYYPIPANPPNIPLCNIWGLAPVTVPKPICSRAGTGLTVLVPTTDPSMGIKSQIFTIPPTDPPTPDDCVGLQLDSTNKLPEGATCLVTVATDNAGNTNVTAPLHVCIDRHAGGGTTDMAGDPCATYTLPKSCTGVWDKTKQMIVPGATCTPEPTFPMGQVVPQVIPQ